MSSFSTLQSRVQTRIIDLRAAVTAEIPTLINEAIDALQSIHNWRCMMAETQFITNSTASNAHILGQIPIGWKEPRGNPYYVLQIGAVREIDWEPNRAFAYRQWDPFDPNSKGPPRIMLLGEATNSTVPDPKNPDVLNTSLNLEVFPYPDGLSDWTTSPAGEYRVNVPYWGNVPDLVNGTDTNWFTENATSFIVDFATARGFMLDWDEQRASYWMQQAWGPKFDGANIATCGGWARVAFNRDKSMAYAPGKTLVPRRDVYAPKNQWRT